MTMYRMSRPFVPSPPDGIGLRQTAIEKYCSVPTWPVKMFARSQNIRKFGYSDIEFINKSATEIPIFFAAVRADELFFILFLRAREPILWVFFRFSKMSKKIRLRRANLLSCFIHELNIRCFSLLLRFIHKLDIRRTFLLPVKMFARGTFQLRS